MTDFDAMMDDATMEQVEAVAAGQEMGIQRRLSLVACARDADTLRKLADNAEMHRRMLGSVQAWKAHCSRLLALAEAAEARLLAVKPRLEVVANSAAGD